MTADGLFLAGVEVVHLEVVIAVAAVGMDGVVKAAIQHRRRVPTNGGVVARVREKEREAMTGKESTIDNSIS